MDIVIYRFFLQFNSIQFNLLNNKNVQKFKKLVCTGKKRNNIYTETDMVTNVMRKYVHNEEMKYIKKIDDWQGGIISINKQQLNVFT